MECRDGMTIDANGLLWVAHWGGFGVYVWSPSTGQLVDKIEVPVPNVASCTFGGKERNRLFITTAVDGLSEAEIQAYPLSGSLFCGRCARCCFRRESLSVYNPLRKWQYEYINN